MSNILDKLFTSDDLKRIEDAVQKAEAQTSGEIVPYVVHASDGYDEALWRAGMTCGGLLLVVLVAIHSFSNAWQSFEVMQVALGTAAASLAGVLLAMYLESVKRFFAGKAVLEHRTAQRAGEAFLAEEVFNTRDRTGILLFLSLLERKVVVLGDAGINAKVLKPEWDGVVKTIVDGMKSGRPADGLVEAIQQCGALLKKEGVAVRPDDTDELKNGLRRSES